MAHVIVDDNRSLDDQLLAALHAIGTQTEVSTVTIPFPGINIPESQLWHVAGLVVKAIERLDSDAASMRGSIRNIVFMNLSILTADVLSVVLRQAFQVVNQQHSEADGNSLQVEVDSVPNETETVITSKPNHDEWYTIECILKQRKYRNKMQYLVKWEGSDVTQWCDRADVTDYAIQRFLANKKRRRRKKRT